MEKYFKFTGTATRSEYWGVLFLSLAASRLLVVEWSIQDEAGRRDERTR